MQNFEKLINTPRFSTKFNYKFKRDQDIKQAYQELKFTLSIDKLKSQRTLDVPNAVQSGSFEVISLCLVESRYLVTLLRPTSGQSLTK